MQEEAKQIKNKISRPNKKVVITTDTINLQSSWNIFRHCFICWLHLKILYFLRFLPYVAWPPTKNASSPLIFDRYEIKGIKFFSSHFSDTYFRLCNCMIKYKLAIPHRVRIEKGKTKTSSLIIIFVSKIKVGGFSVIT